MTGRKPIVRAAIKLNDHVVMIGFNHGEIMFSIPGFDSLELDQGFIDTNGRFLNREQSRMNAEIHNQMKGQVFNSDQLFSEHVIYADGKNSQGEMQDCDNCITCTCKGEAHNVDCKE